MTNRFTLTLIQVNVARPNARAAMIERDPWCGSIRFPVAQVTRHIVCVSVGSYGPRIVAIGEVREESLRVRKRSWVAGTPGAGQRPQPLGQTA